MRWLATRSRISSEVFHRLIGDMWEWYRARRMALELKSILEDAKVTKPVWIFTLGWEQGHQHGQDPMMLVDAGASLNGIMLYHCTRSQYEDMMKRWDRYLQTAEGSFIGGEMVDFDAHDRSHRPPAPQEAWERQGMAAATFLKKNARAGLFWHDLSRILGGRKGPYTGLEWAVAGGASFTTLRETAGRLPLQVTLMGPDRARDQSTVSLSISISNTTDKSLDNVKVQWIDPSSRSVLGGIVQVIGTVPAGRTVMRVNQMKMDRIRPLNKMAACVVTWGPGHHTDRAFAYRYVHTD